MPSSEGGLGGFVHRTDNKYYKNIYIAAVNHPFLSFKLLVSVTRKYHIPNLEILDNILRNAPKMMNLVADCIESTV